PNKSSRSVNALRQTDSFSRFLSTLGQGALVFSAAVVALFSGGVGSVGVALIVLCPVLLAVLQTWERARPAILFALVALLSLGAMTVAGWVPPAIPLLPELLVWAVLAFAGVILVLALMKRSEDRIVDEREAQEREPSVPSLQDIAGLGHDLKSPLTSILGFSQIMKDRELGPDASRYEAYPDFIHQSAQTLEARVSTLLELIKTESGGLSLEMGAVDLSDVTEGVIARLNAQALAADVELMKDIDAGVVALGDVGACERIVENLVSNAIKYSDAGGRVFVTGERDGAWVILSVADDGTGIGAADLAKLAEPFTQAGHTGAREGTGIGLALVKRLVELQKGEFRIRTAAGRGTQMIVKLPAYNAKA
ncbi:MAG: HAMP domain-containing sensor histidine kinase, partial [Pseudomonadota bacterium]